MSSHPTGWDFSNPNCDWRNTPGIKEYCFNNWDRNIETLLSYEYYKKFNRANQNQERPFEPRGPLPVLNLVNDPAVNPAIPQPIPQIEVDFQAWLQPRRLGLLAENNPGNVIVDEMPDDVQPDVELDDFDFDEEHPHGPR
jgi:hypothetical protein